MEIQQEFDFNYKRHEEAKLGWIDIKLCQPHPLNPRLAFNEEQVERITEQINLYGYKPEHAITVRPVNEHYQIVSGHHRVEACKRSGKDKILAWVHKDMSDERAHSLLLLDNDQSELTPLEKGKHAFDHIETFDHKGGRGQTGGISEYARVHGLKSEAIARQWLGAYEVVLKTSKLFRGLSPTVLYEISKSPGPAWQSLCQSALEEGWTVAQTKEVVDKTKEIKTGDGYGYDLSEIFCKAIKNKGRLANQYKDLFDRITYWVDTLEDSITLYQWVDTGEERQNGLQILRKYIAEPYKYQPKEKFVDRIKTNHPLKSQTVDDYAHAILQKITTDIEGGERWVPQLSDAELARLGKIERENAIQLYLDDHIKLGDCFDILPELPKKHFDALITDPPYGVGYDTWDEIDNPAQYTANWVKLCLPLLKEKHHILIFCSSKLVTDIEIALRDVITVPLQSRIIWHHRNLTLGRDAKTAFINSYDVILHYGNKDLYFDDDWSDERFDVMEFAVPQSNFKEDAKEHKAQKPIELMRRLVKHCVTQNENVLDPFAGTGTTGVAVLELKGHPTLIEKESVHVQTMRRRLREVL